VIQPSEAREKLGEIRLSPDGSHIAIARSNPNDPQLRDLWDLELSRHALTRLTFGPGSSNNPVWSPDGRQIAYSNDRDGASQIYIRNAFGTGAEERLTIGGNAKFPQDWSRDGRWLLYGERNAAKNNREDLSIWALSVQRDPSGNRKAIPLVQSSFLETNPQFSPDGKWFVYGSTESGRPEIYIQTFPVSGGKWQVSTAGGLSPRWRGDGNEIYYYWNGRVWAVGVRVVNGRPQVDSPRRLFTMVDAGGLEFLFDVTRDGQRFFLTQPPELEVSTPISVVANWQAGLK
jgi:Tol biopolymer transport system component